MYKKLKKQNGETFARTIRDYHNGILELPDVDIILQHAGREAEPLLPYLTSLLNADNSEPIPEPQDPLALLKQAGYEAFHADTLEKQNSIKRYFKQGELLCTFNDNSRYKRYHIVNAVKKDVDKIKREDFNGEEKREDEYGTSVISIQMLKDGGFISIKNRYNHTVSNCDNTFGSNPDNIIDGLSSALKDRFNVDFSVNKSPLPDDFTVIGNQIFKYHREANNIYYGDQKWAENGAIYKVNKSAGDALFDVFLFDNKSKTLKKIDFESRDNFVDDFNRCYGGNRGLSVKNGNLTLNGDVLIGAEQSQIKTIYLPDLTTMGYGCLSIAHGLTKFEAPALNTMADGCLYNADALKQFEAPKLTTMGNCCLYFADALTQFEAPELITMGNDSLCNVDKLTKFEAPSLTSMGGNCFQYVSGLKQLDAPALASMGSHCFYRAYVLTQFEAPELTAMGRECLGYANKLERLEAPLLKSLPHHLERFSNLPKRTVNRNIAP